MRNQVLVAISLLFAGCGDDGDDRPSTEPNIELTDDDGTTIESVVFGQALVGQDASSTVHVTNRGTATTGPIALSIGGAAANDFAIDNVGTTCAARSLQPNASCEIVLFFRPTAVGERAATLVVTSDPGGTFSVAVTGVASMPDLHFNPTTISFDRLEVGTSAQTTIELRNDGTDAAPIDSIMVTGAAFSRGFSTCGAMLAPGASCDISITAAPQSLGTIAGDITVESGAVGYTAGLAVAGARKITVAMAGTGSGTITSTPAGIDCGATCSALFEGAVTLTVNPGANTAITSWSIPGCAQSTSCAVPVDTTPLTVNLSLALTGSSSVNLTFAGDSTGEVKVTKTGTGLVATCFGSCPVPAEPGDMLTLGASTVSTFTGFTGGGCSGTACSLSVAVGSTTITATFTKDAKEQWTRLLPGATPHAAAFDGSGNLIVASTNKLFKLGPTGSTLWSKDMTANGLETGPNDTIYVVTGTELKKLDASGQELWTRSTPTVCTRAHGVAVDSDGTVAVRSGSTVSRWDSSGTLSWTKTFTRSADRCSVAIDATKNVLVDVENLNAESTDAYIFAPNGSELTPLENITNQYYGTLTSSPTGEITTCSSGHSDSYLKSPGVSTSIVIGAPAYAENWCDRAGTDAAWVYLTTDFSPPSPPPQWYAKRWNAGGAAWTLLRERTSSGIDNYGTYPTGVAGSSDGMIGVVGRYVGITADSAWIQVYAP